VDIIARYGGDEFFILLPETDQITGENVASRLCSEIAAANISKDGRKLSVTISVGLASLTDDIPDLLNLIDRANQAEHVAKQKGNCVVVWDEKISAPDQVNGTIK
jgi:diguanylate cyclase (GGDEF)-like protein